MISGNRTEALGFYERLAAQFPDRRDVQTTWGELLYDEGIRTSARTTLEKSLKQWREIEKRSENQSEAWFEAKYRIASLYIALGNRAWAEKMVRSLSVLYPEMGGEEMKDKFQKILQTEKRDKKQGEKQ